MDSRYSSKMKTEAKKQEKEVVQPAQQEVDLEELIDSITKHQKLCEEEGRYVEAEMAKNRAKELKEQLKQQQKDELDLRHQNDLVELEESHIQEFNLFNEEWDVRMNQFQVHSQQLINALDEKQQKQIEDLKAEQMNGEQPDLFKPSTDLQKLISTQKNLAKQKEYQQAHQIQIKAQKLEMQERNKYAQELENKNLVKENKLIKQQEIEMESLRKRIVAGENEQKKQRALDLEKMFQRYQNVKSELEKNHKREKIYFDKSMSFYTANVSKMSYKSGGESSAYGVHKSAQKKRPTNVIQKV